MMMNQTAVSAAVAVCAQWAANRAAGVAAAVMMLIAAAGAVHAETIHVPKDYATIQAAIDAAMPGDEIVIAPGTYNEAIDLLGKPIALIGSGGAEQTIIDGRGLDSTVVTIVNVPQPGARLEDLTITGVNNTLIIFTGSVYVSSSVVKLTRCIVRENVAAYGTAGIRVGAGSDIEMRYCIVEGNTSINGYGGMTSSNSNVLIDACEFRANVASIEHQHSVVFLAAYNGESVYVNDTLFESNAGITTIEVYGGTESNPIRFEACTIRGNRGMQGVGMYVSGNAYTDIIACQFEDNWSDSGPPVYQSGAGIAVRSSSTPGLLRIEDCEFRNNRAASGAAVIVFGNIVKFSNCLFEDNVSDPGIGAAITVTGSNNAYAAFSHCRFEGNHSQRGGAAAGYRGTLEFQQCEFIDNTAEFNGGAIYGYGQSNIHADQCIFESNQSLQGGALYFTDQSSATLTACSFVNNGAAAQGGAAYHHSDAGTLAYDNCSFIDNEAGSDGGAVASTSTQAAFEHCNFSGNTAVVGGGMANGFNAAATLVNCKFIDNLADLGGGLANEFGGVATLVDCTFESNAAIYGGGIYNDFADIDIDQCAFRFNVADGGYGSAIGKQSGTISIGNSQFCGNLPPGTQITGSYDDVGGNMLMGYCTRPLVIHVPNDLSSIQQAVLEVADGGEVIVGPGVYNVPIAIPARGITLRSSHGPAMTVLNGGGFEDSIITCAEASRSDRGTPAVTRIEGFTFINGKGKPNPLATDGGAIFALSDLEVADCVFQFNTATSEGGAIDSHANLKVINCMFEHNAASHRGGAIYSHANLEVIDCVLGHNTASGEGGAIYSQANLEVVNCVFERNTGGFGGGAIRLHEAAGALTVKETTFMLNEASTGGAIHGGNNDMEITVTDCVFTENSAANAGALYISGGTVERCEFIANTTESAGGAIRATVGLGSFLTLNDCVLSGNTAGDRGGAISFLVLNPQVSVNNCTFNENHADEGGAIYTTSFYDGAVTITGSKFKNNTADTQGGAIYVYPTGNESDAVVADTLFCGNLPEHIAGLWLDNGGNEFHDACSVSADITGDGLVNIDDLLAVIASWGPCPAMPDECPADIAPVSTNGDGMVNVDDLLAVLANWGG